MYRGRREKTTGKSRRRTVAEGLMDWDLAVARGQRMREAKQIFLTAEWRDLAMLNYEVDPSLLEQYVPPGTDLDSFERKTYVRFGGFLFQ
jgi:hypothetical protein